MTTSDGSQKELFSEDYCFICKDGGDLIICDYRDCLKVYHLNCVDKYPTFAETGKKWDCGWHSCFRCQKSSIFRCLCCPKSFCHRCLKDYHEFVPRKENSMGFCSHCLKLAKLIEENSNVDSDGEKVDFNDTDTYEYLFRDYWVIVKDHEKISSEEIHAAYSLLKDSKSLDHVSVKSDKKDDKDLNNIGLQDSSLVHVPKLKSRSNYKRRHLKRKVFTGWGSVELMSFLIHLGNDCKEPISQLDVFDIIKKYIYDNNLLHPDKKRKEVLCDEKLYSLFKKKTMKLFKIMNSLESHYKPDGVDGYNFSDFEDESIVTRKRQVTTHLKNVSESPRSYYASIVSENIKLIYLKKSLILELLKNFGEFENKVVGCFVRVKNDPKDFPYSQDKVYQLQQINGIKKTLGTGKTEERRIDVTFRVSNMSKDILISMLSDDDFEEEELDDLRQLVKDGHLKRLTIAELKQKSILLHEEITRHWIKTELVKLKKQIDRANEKGWRRQLNSLIDTRELLRTNAEQERLLKKIPGVIPSTELVECTLDSKGAIQRNEELDTGRFNFSDAKDRGVEEKENVRAVQVVKIDNDDDDKRNTCRQKRPSHTQIINSVDEGDGDNASPANDMVPPLGKEAAKSNRWNYVDPLGDAQGSFELEQLKMWREQGFFDDDFKVWRADQTRDEAILLTVALHLL